MHLCWPKGYTVLYGTSINRALIAVSTNETPNGSLKIASTASTFEPGSATAPTALVEAPPHARVALCQFLT